MKIHEVISHFGTSIFEARIDNIIQARGDKLVAFTKQHEGKELTAEAITSELAKADPTPQAKNIQWIVNQYMKGQFRLEDVSRVKGELIQFRKIQNRLSQPDLNRYDYHEMAELMDKEFNNVSVDDVSNDQSFGPDVKVLYKGPLGLLTVPKTKEAAQLLGKGTKWCTSSENNNMFDSYNSQAPLYIWKDKSGKKIQLWFPLDADDVFQIMDARDIELDSTELQKCRSHPVLKSLFSKYEQKIIEKNDSDHTYNYVKEVLKERWPEGESAIMAKPNNSYEYAVNIIKGRWPEAEEVIMTAPYIAFRYASKILKRRWPEAEEVIKKSHVAWRSYTNRFDITNEY